MIAGNKWDIRLLRLLSVLVVLCFSIVGYLEWIDTPKPVLLDYVLVRITPILIISIFIFIFFTVQSERYPIYLLIAIISFHICINGFSLGHELAGYRKPSSELLGTGRMMDYIFSSFYLTAIVGLFFSRLWAVYLWLLLSLISPVKTYLIISSYENVYFTNDWSLIISDGFAINKWAFNDGLMTLVFFMLFIVVIAHFSRWVMASTIKTETENANLGRYFSPDVKEEIKNGGININSSDPKEMNVAVVFTDIVNFTQLSEKMHPSDVLVLLSDYQTLMVEAIFEYNGTVDKFIGDAIMANFGTPKSYGNDAQNAFDCAVYMNKLLKNWNEQREKENQVLIEHRIGIHYGTCVVGNMGSSQRIEFAVIGDTVNVASRICSACKEFDTNFIISNELAKLIKFDLPSELISGYSVRGRDERLDLVKIYQV